MRNLLVLDLKWLLRVRFELFNARASMVPFSNHVAVVEQSEMLENLKVKVISRSR